MKRLTLALVCIAVASTVLTGCKSSDSRPMRTTYAADGSVVESSIIDSATELGLGYYNQPNMAQLINAEGSNITWQITGCTKLVFSTPVPTKQIIPREKSWTDSAGDTLKTIAPWIFMGYWIHEGGFGNTKTTTTTTN